MALKDVKLNHTDVVLTEENTQQDVLGFIEARCPHCEAKLHLSSEGIVQCLNGCYLPSRILKRVIEVLRAIS